LPVGIADISEKDRASSVGIAEFVWDISISFEIDCSIPIGVCSNIDGKSASDIRRSYSFVSTNPRKRPLIRTNQKR